MPSITLPVALAGTAAAGVASAGIGAAASLTAAGDQESAEEYAANVQQQMYNQTAARLAPYNTAGQSANAQISGMAPFSFNPSMATLENSPGYQFNLKQGLESTQASAAARGLGVSGAALKGAAGYSQGLAGNQYLFSNALQSYTTNLGRLQGQAGLGENAAAMTGNFGTQTAQAIGQTAVGAANAQAAGLVGTANAATGGLNTASNAFLTSALFGRGMYGGQTAGGIGADAYEPPY